MQNFKVTKSYIQARKAALAKSREQERKELSRLKGFCSCICVHLFFLYISVFVIGCNYTYDKVAVNLKQLAILDEISQ